MKIKISHIIHLMKKYHNSIEIRYLQDVSSSDHRFEFGEVAELEHMNIFSKSGLPSVDIIYTQALYNYLITEFPLEFPKPYGQLRFVEMDKLIEKISSVNTNSKRKRQVILVGDIYRHDRNENKMTVLFSHGQSLDFEMWNMLKRDIDKNQKFNYRFSEVAIIIFVDMNVLPGPEYVDKFKINADLISLMVSKATNDSEIAPDFIPTQHVISVTDPRLLLEEYIRTNARMIIIGEKLGDSYKKALLEVRQYDRFVRMMVIPTIDHENIDHFFKQVKLVYHSDRWLE